MNTFHGSDLEKIEQVYGIRKEEITGFGANVNPLGLSPFLKDYLAGHLDVLCAYPDRNYTALRRAISAYTGAPVEHILVGTAQQSLFLPESRPSIQRTPLSLAPPIRNMSGSFPLWGVGCIIMI